MGRRKDDAFIYSNRISHFPDIYTESSDSPTMHCRLLEAMLPRINQMCSIELRRLNRNDLHLIKKNVSNYEKIQEKFFPLSESAAYAADSTLNHFTRRAPFSDHFYEQLW